MQSQIAIDPALATKAPQRLSSARRVVRAKSSGSLPPNKKRLRKSFTKSLCVETPCHRKVILFTPMFRHALANYCRRHHRCCCRCRCLAFIFADRRDPGLFFERWEHAATAPLTNPAAAPANTRRTIPFAAFTPPRFLARFFAPPFFCSQTSCCWLWRLRLACPRLFCLLRPERLTTSSRRFVNRQTFSRRPSSGRFARAFFRAAFLAATFLLPPFLLLLPVLRRRHRRRLSYRTPFLRRPLKPPLYRSFFLCHRLNSPFGRLRFSVSTS